MIPFPSFWIYLFLLVLQFSFRFFLKNFKERGTYKGRTKVVSARGELRGETEGVRGVANGDGDLRDIQRSIERGGPQVDVGVDVSQRSGRLLTLVVTARVSAGVQEKISQSVPT